jgi:hypothetical protein
MLNINSKNPIDQVCVLIRSVGERTETVCRELILSQDIPPENIIVIKKTPFTLALQAAFETGIAYNCPWTFCVDADVLLLPGSIQKMLALAEKQKSNVCEIQGRVLDKFLGGPREAGNHLYRTSLLKIALENLPLDPNTLRPETDTLSTMKQKGYPHVSVSLLVGIHDFEQYYRDIYRKCFVQAHKHLEYSQIYLTYWPSRTIQDSDYEVALNAYFDGIKYLGNVQIDAEQDIYAQFYEKLSLAEKPEIPSGSIAPSSIKHLADNWVEPSIYNQYFWNGKKPPEIYDSYLPTRRERIVEQIKTRGLIRFILFSIGWGLEKFGSWIKSLGFH